MAKMKIVPVLAVLFALAAATLSYKLLTKHLTGSTGSAWFEAGCGAGGEEGGADCAAVLASPYSYWPPKKENESKDTGHIPIAFLGLVYYSVLTVWFIGVGRPSYSRRWLHLLPMGLIAAGLAASAFFTAIMFARLHEWCLWCLITHVLNLLIAVCVVLLWPGAAPPKADSLREPGETGLARRAGLKPAARTHPSWRLVLVTATAIWLVVVGLNQMLGKARYAQAARSNKQGFDQCMAVLDRYKGDTDALVEAWRKAPSCSITIRSDDPARLKREGTANSLEAVVFSDLECSSCKRLAEFLENEVEPLFDGYLKVVFKHYPLNSGCNPMTETQKHRHACDAAVMAEAARIVGGNDAFWRAHDYLFEHQDRLKRGRLAPEDVAAELGIDPQRLNDAMQSEIIAGRIRQDAHQGRACGVNATPTLFVSGRRVDPLARSEIHFWDRLADLYWQGRNEPRPESTKLTRPAATPDNRGQRAAP